MTATESHPESTGSAGDQAHCWSDGPAAGHRRPEGTRRDQLGVFLGLLVVAPIGLALWAILAWLAWRLAF